MVTSHTAANSVAAIIFGMSMVSYEFTAPNTEGCVCYNVKILGNILNLRARWRGNNSFSKNVSGPLLTSLGKNSSRPVLGLK